MADTRYSRPLVLRFLGLHTNIRDELETHQKLSRSQQQVAGAVSSTQDFSEEAGGPKGHQAYVQLSQG